MFGSIRTLVIALSFAFPLSSFAAQFHMTVKGMTCGGCESMIEKKVSQLPHVKSVKADHSKGFVTVTTEEGKATPSEQDLKKAVTDAGYQVVKFESK